MKNLIQEQLLKSLSHSVFLVRMTQESTFLSTILGSWYHAQGKQFVHLDPQQLKNPEGLAQIYTAFLGQTSVFWLGSLSLLDAASKTIVHKILRTYEGPHLLVAAVVADDTLQVAAEQSCLLDFAQRTTVKEFLMLMFPSVTVEQVEKIALTREQEKMTIDELIMFTRYKMVVGKQQALFEVIWKTKIRSHDSSLFMLSNYFFSRKRESFFSLWCSLKKGYESPFWVVYWSEQLFRAACCKEFLESKQMVQAKQMAYRLPFSFLQKDVRNWSNQQLTSLHDFLTTGDAHFKNGGSDLFIELFYHKAFAE